MKSSSAERLEPPQGGRFVKPLQGKHPAAWLVVRQDRDEPVIVERLSGPKEDVAAFAARAASVARVSHRNVAHLSAVEMASDDAVVTYDYVDGIMLPDLLSHATEPLPLGLALRVLLDVMSGLTALHDAQDAQGKPLNLAHGELGPSFIIVGSDGTARIAHACRPQPIKSLKDSPSLQYLAPEVLLRDPSSGELGDLYSVGAMLWECIADRPLRANRDPARILADQLSERVEVPLPREPWAAPLIGTIMRTLATDPSKRPQTAAALAAEVRKALASRIGTTGDLVRFIERVHGTRIRERRGILAASMSDASGARPRLVSIGGAQVRSKPPLPTTSSAPPRAPLASAAEVAEWFDSSQAHDAPPDTVRPRAPDLSIIDQSRRTSPDLIDARQTDPTPEAAKAMPRPPPTPSRSAPELPRAPKSSKAPGVPSAAPVAAPPPVLASQPVAAPPPVLASQPVAAPPLVALDSPGTGASAVHDSAVHDTDTSPAVAIPIDCAEDERPQLPASVAPTPQLVIPTGPVPVAPASSAAPIATPIEITLTSDLEDAPTWAPRKLPKRALLLGAAIVAFAVIVAAMSGGGTQPMRTVMRYPVAAAATSAADAPGPPHEPVAPSSPPRDVAPSPPRDVAPSPPRDVAPATAKAPPPRVAPPTAPKPVPHAAPPPPAGNPPKNRTYEPMGI